MGYNPSTQGTRLRRYVGYMPEHPALPPDVSATEFVAQAGRLSGLPTKVARERTADVLRHVGLAEERYRPIAGYSTGMRQRVQLAQAIVHDPRLLLLDEPTNGLDPAGRDEMLGLIRRTGTEFGIAIVLASHLLGEIEAVCDHLVAIDGGRLLRAAPMAAFTAETGILTVEVEDGRDALAAGLAGRGLRVLEGSGRADRTVRIALDGGAPFDVVRDTVADLGLPLVRMEHGRHSLEDLFRDDLPAAAVTSGGTG
jgi:ABC-2 type transport system ATP-binding protein